MNVARWSWSDLVVGCVFVASFFAPPVLNAVGWWRWSKGVAPTRLRNSLTIAGLILNAIASATTALMVVSALLAGSMGGGPSFADIGWVTVFVVGASALSAVCGLLGMPRVRMVLVASSVLAGTFWPMLVPGLGFL